MERQTVDGFVNHAMSRAATALARWLPASSIERNLRMEIESLLSTATPPGAAPIVDRPEVVAVDTATRPMALLAIPRLHADSRTCAHAAIPYRTADCPADDLPVLLDAVVTRFAALGVDRVCVFTHGPEQRSATSTAVAVAPYKRFMAISLAEVDASPPPPHADRVSVHTPTDLSFFLAYEAMYRDFWAAAPHLRDVIGIETHEDLEEFLRDGGLRLVEVDGKLAGVIGAVRRVEQGLRGWRLRERVMSKDFRGGGFATAALWRFARDVRRDPGDLMWGTIMHENQPSMRSALRLGRVDVGGLVWIAANPPYR